MTERRYCSQCRGNKYLIIKGELMACPECTPGLKDVIERKKELGEKYPNLKKAMDENVV